MMRELSRASVDVTNKLSQLFFYKEDLFSLASSIVGTVAKPEAKEI